MQAIFGNIGGWPLIIQFNLDVCLSIKLLLLVYVSVDIWEVIVIHFYYGSLKFEGKTTILFVLKPACKVKLIATFVFLLPLLTGSYSYII